MAPDPRGVCRAAQGLVVAPPDAARAGLPDQRMAERNTRPASLLLERLLELDGDAGLDQPRPVAQRVVGTCRHFAVLATAFLRASDVPARGRCGFATDFIPPKKVDHWIVEYWCNEERRWIRIDPEYVDLETPGGPELTTCVRASSSRLARPGRLLRSGQEDPADFGVFGSDNWGPGEVRGNAMRDLASLVRKVEMLPWDVWGPIEASYDGETGADFDLLIDQLAVACHSHDEPELERIYEQLSVPAVLIC